jgi:hypothetical protein
MEIQKVGDPLHYSVIPAPGGNRAFAAKNYLFTIPQYAFDPDKNSLKTRITEIPARVWQYSGFT